MNYGRLALAAAVATVVDAVYGFVVYGNVISSEFQKYPGIYRPSDVQTGYLPLMFVGLLFAMLVAAYMYAKGYEGGSGVQEGMRFGALIGLLVVGYVAGVDYATMNIGRRMAVYFAFANLVEWIVVGVTIGFVYHPATPAAASGRAAGV
jgi:FtsH-binding integral membrane protein